VSGGGQHAGDPDSFGGFLVAEDDAGGGEELLFDDVLGEQGPVELS